MLRLLAGRSYFNILRTSTARSSNHRHKPFVFNQLGSSAMATLSQDWQTVTKGPDVPLYTVFNRPVQKSQQDDRDYRLIRLENGLEAMLIHDPKADKAAASLDVAVGHLRDPDDMPGLAHFCEHLLFMGTKQYPRENEYSEYLAKNNGSSNAYTSTTNTNYFFSVSTGALPGALSRFAAFFHCPLFEPSCTTRELNAVESEFKKNLQSDLWRLFQVTKHLSKEDHVWRKFGSGNKDSLTRVGRELKAKGETNGTVASNGDASGETEADGGVVGRETRRRLVEWWSREYCAGRMRLCVIGKESLDELSDMVSQLFSPILNRGLDPLPLIEEHPFGANEMGTIVNISTVMSFHALEIYFPLPYLPPYWRHHPGNFLAHFVGHEGPGSLHSYLKNRHWIIALSAGPQALARGFSTFKVTLRLTKEGYDNYREVCLAIFKYLSLLRSSPLAHWNQQEISTLRSIRFRFQEKRRPEDYAVWVSEHMSWPVPRHLVISAPQLTEPWDTEEPMKSGGGEKEVREMLDELSVENSRTVLMARKEEHERIAGGPKAWEIEQWYGTEFTVEKYDEEFVKSAQAPNDLPQLALPPPNEFIPTNLEIDKKEVTEPSKRPHLVRETPLGCLWHKKDDQFWVPRAQVIMEITNPIANESAKNSVMTRLFADLVTDALNEYAYDADLAGLSYNFSAYANGVFVSLNGYNDKLHILTKDVFEEAKKLVINPERMKAKKEEMVRDWENFFLDQPCRISDYYARYLLAEKLWTLDEKLKEIASITVEELQKFSSQLLSNVYIRALIVGNMYKDEAIRLVESTEQILQASALPSKSIFELSLIPPPGSNHVWSMAGPNANDSNSALTYYTYLGSALSPRNRVMSYLLIQILSEPTFNILRTKEQLGYIVTCSGWSSIGDSELGLRILVQSEKGPVFLEERVEAFLDEMKQKLETMEDGEFEEQKGGLEKKWREKLKNMAEETMKYWTQIDSGYLDFLRKQNDADLLHTITKQDILSHFLTYVHPSSSTRAKVSLQLRSQKPRPKHMSKEALDAFVAAAVKFGLPVNSQLLTQQKDKEPTVDQVAAFCKQAFGAAGVPPKIAEQLLGLLPKLAEQYPAPSDHDEGSLKAKEGVVMIEDLSIFKKGLKRSEPPKPLVEWGDLPTAKF